MLIIWQINLHLPRNWHVLVRNALFLAFLICFYLWSNLSLVVYYNSGYLRDTTEVSAIRSHPSTKFLNFLVVSGINAMSALKADLNRY